MSTCMPVSLFLCLSFCMSGRLSSCSNLFLYDCQREKASLSHPTSLCCLCLSLSVCPSVGLSIYLSAAFSSCAQNVCVHVDFLCCVPLCACLYDSLQATVCLCRCLRFIICPCRCFCPWLLAKTKVLCIDCSQWLKAHYTLKRSCRNRYLPLSNLIPWKTL